jgi:hypothetical protein
MSNTDQVFVFGDPSNLGSLSSLGSLVVTPFPARTEQEHKEHEESIYSKYGFGADRVSSNLTWLFRHD